MPRLILTLFFSFWFSVANAAIHSDYLCPVPYEMSVPNRTGVQCVWCSLEVLGNYLQISQLYNLTDRSRCKGPAGPGDVKEVLSALQVKYIQATNKEDGLKLIKHWTGHNLCCLIGIPGHAIVCINYDENRNLVTVIDNVGDRHPKNWTIEKFNRLFDDWVVCVYPIQKVNHNIAVRQFYFAP